MLTLEWWNQLEEQWKKAFNEAFWNKGAVLDAPNEEELKDISTTTVLRIVGPEAPYPNCSFELTNSSGLAALTQLEILVLTYHRIDKIGEISNLTSLKSLFLNGNYTKDISGMEKLVNLEELYIQDNEIEDTSAVGKLEKVKTLYVAKNKISTFAVPPNIKSFHGMPNENIPDSEIIRLERDLRILVKEG